MIATQKIVELSRKNRELQAELATERNKSRLLRSRLNDLQEVVKSEKVRRSFYDHGCTCTVQYIKCVLYNNIPSAVLAAVLILKAHCVLHVQ